MSDWKQRDARKAASYLLRFWVEPREGGERDPEIRGYLRNLRTGEEILIRDPDEVAKLILRELRGELAEAGELTDHRQRLKG